MKFVSRYKSRFESLIGGTDEAAAREALDGLLFSEE